MEKKIIFQKMQFVGRVRCPYCKHLTKFKFIPHQQEGDRCVCCGQRYAIIMKFEAKRLKKKVLKIEEK